jgi:undecaprenyl-diphosphatase
MARDQDTAAPPVRPDRRARARPRFGIFGDALYSMLRFIARHVRGFWTAIAAFLTLGLALGAAAAAAFAVVAGVVETGFLQTVDERALHWFAARRSPLLDRVMLDITTLGDGIVLVVLVAIVSVFLWLTGHRWSVYLLCAGVIGGQLVNNMLKIMFARPRPDVIDWVDHVTTKSFPSGHAMSAIIAYGSVAYLVGRLEPTTVLRRTTWAIAVLIIVAIGTSRVYLGVHYPSDVLAGFLAGLAWLAFVVASVRAIHFFAQRRPAATRDERSA